MGKKSTPQAPTPVDPVALANAQGAANTATAQQQQKLNMVGSSGPDGSVSWSADASQPGGYTQTTTLSPAQQQIYDSGNQAQIGALGIANDQLGRVNTALQTPLTSPHLQTSLGPQGAIQGQIADAGNIQRGVNLQNTYGNGGTIQQDVGPTDFTRDRQDVTNAVWDQAISRLAPQYGQMASRLDQRLANQGIGINSAAHGNAYDEFGRQTNDALNQSVYSAIQAGANEQNTLFGQKLAQGQFHNTAQGQGNQQNLQAADFYNNAALNAGNFANQAQAQQYGQNATNAQFQNQAQNQGFNQSLAAAQFGNTASGQQFQNDAYAQNQPINQFNSLMSSGQVSMPQGFGYTPTQVNGTDVIGANALNAQQQQANYNTQSQAASAARTGLLGGLFSLGSAGLTGGLSLLKK